MLLELLQKGRGLLTTTLLFLRFMHRNENSKDIARKYEKSRARAMLIPFSLTTRTTLPQPQPIRNPPNMPAATRQAPLRVPYYGCGYKSQTSNAIQPTPFYTHQTWSLTVHPPPIRRTNPLRVPFATPTPYAPRAASQVEFPTTHFNA